jgi:pimeloyl-ACP methyl ester carboxylesterase
MQITTAGSLRRLPWIAALAVAIAVTGGCKSSNRPTAPASGTDTGTADQNDAAGAAASQDVELTTEDGVLLAATLFPGPARRGQGGADPAIVLVHQLSSTRAEWKPFVDRLVASHTVLTIDLRGHGDSTRTESGDTLSWQSFDDADWAKIPLDVKAAVAYLRDLDPPPAGVSVMGSSIGSSAVVLYAADDADVTSVAMLSPGLSYRNLDTEPAVRALGDRPLLLMASRGDTGPAGAVETLGMAAQHAEQHIYDGSAHGVSIAVDNPELIDHVVSFFTGVGAP